jgi:hypothetical protein
MSRELDVGSHIIIIGTSINRVYVLTHNRDMEKYYLVNIVSGRRTFSPGWEYPPSIERIRACVHNSAREVTVSISQGGVAIEG